MKMLSTCTYQNNLTTALKSFIFPIFYTLTSVCIFSKHLETFPANKENLFNSQKLLELVIISFIP